MELVLDRVEGAPEGGILSIKIGETRRQAPLSKLGQSFSFSSAPTAPLPLSVEVLVPVAAPRKVVINPLQEEVVISIDGNTKVHMRQQVAKNQRPVPDVNKVVADRGLIGNQKDLATKAGAYLEMHGMVRLFQDLLHGLIVSCPEDPWKYLFEHLGRAQTVATQTTQQIPTLAHAHYTPSTQAVQAPEFTPVPKQLKRGAIRQISKVDRLMGILKQARENYALISPYLPEDMNKTLASAAFADECQTQFAELDTANTGYLGAEALHPVIVRLSKASQYGVSIEQCRKFMSFFDANEDGSIQASEFTSLMQFFIVAVHLESDEGKAVVTHATVEEKRFKEFIDMLHEDKSRIDEIVPFLPDWFLQQLTSDSFLDSCIESFDDLDKDKSHSLESAELVPVVIGLSNLDQRSVNLEKVKQFVTVFDVDGNGAIQRDEFLEFAQFMLVMSFLTTAEGQQVQEVASHVSEQKKCDALISKLEADPSQLAEVMSFLPRSILNQICGKEFGDVCDEVFNKLDKNGNEALEPTLLFPWIIELSASHPMTIDQETCKVFTAIFDKDQKGLISLDDFPTLCKFVIAMGYLKFTKDWRENEVNHSRADIERLLTLLRGNCDRLDQVLPLVPFAMREELTSKTFESGCMECFDGIDKDKNGTLEPPELVSIIIHMLKAHPLALTKDQCLKFVDIFDTERTGVINRSDFLNLTRFVHIMGYLEKEEYKLSQVSGDSSKGKAKVIDFLKMLEQNRNAMHKILPLLPQDIFDQLASDEFIEQCHKNFAELDVDGNGVLSPDELLPIVVETSKAHPHSIDLEQCKRFTKIFDFGGDGLIQADEFLDFARMMAILGYLHSDEGEREFGECLEILAGSRQVDDLMQMVEQDRKTVRHVIPYLPIDLQDELLSEKFTLDALDYFRSLDKDASGNLDPKEIYPLIKDMTKVHGLALDTDTCARFMAIFDDQKTGVITQKDFVAFIRFTVIQRFLETEDGKKALELLADNRRAPTTRSPARSRRVSVTSSTPVSPSMLQSAALSTPEVAEHLAVDVDYYQQKVERLTKEKTEQSDQMNEMEVRMRAMEETMRLQEGKLQSSDAKLSESK